MFFFLSHQRIFFYKREQKVVYQGYIHRRSKILGIRLVRIGAHYIGPLVPHDDGKLKLPKRCCQNCPSHRRRRGAGGDWGKKCWLPTQCLDLPATTAAAGRGGCETIFSACPVPAGGGDGAGGGFSFGSWNSPRVRGGRVASSSGACSNSFAGIGARSKTIACVSGRWVALESPESVCGHEPRRLCLFVWCGDARCALAPQANQLVHQPARLSRHWLQRGFSHPPSMGSLYARHTPRTHPRNAPLRHCDALGNAMHRFETASEGLSLYAFE
jgi:hypothetical protein